MTASELAHRLGRHVEAIVAFVAEGLSDADIARELSRLTHSQVTSDEVSTLLDAVVHGQLPGRPGR